MSDYQELMHELYKAHQNLKKEWNDWRNGKLKPTQKKKLNKSKNVEPENVTLARDKFYSELNRLFDTKLAPLQIKISQNPLSAVDEVIEFLSVDIPAYRCGYVKEFLLTKLKSVELNNFQEQKLKQIFLDLCENYKFRREFNYWSRLMLKIADDSFVQKLKELSASSNRYAQIKSKWMLDKISHHRKDLAESLD